MAYNNPTFVLLPDFSFLPGGQLDIGTVLSQDSEGLPDPRRVFESAKLPMSLKTVTSQELEPWHWTSHDSTTGSAGINAGISLFTGIGAGVHGNRARNETLDIRCKRLVQQTYLPAVEDFEQLLKHDAISKYLKGFYRPSVFLVTGLMIAYDSSIEVGHGNEHGGGSHASADVTSIGVPLNVGINGEFSQRHGKTLITSPKRPFILAYQLHRLRRKLIRGHDARIETRPRRLYYQSVRTRLEAEEPEVYEESDGYEELEDYEVKVLSPALYQQAYSEEHGMPLENGQDVDGNHIIT